MPQRETTHIAPGKRQAYHEEMITRAIVALTMLVLLPSCGLIGGSSSTTNQNRVFVTSQSYNGNLGGLDGADLKCQMAATTAGLSGIWKAWLSAAGVEPASRLKLSYPIKDIHGQVVFADASTMNATILVPPALDETGHNQSGNVWTNTDPTGHELTASCNNWLTSTAGFTGEVGQATATSLGEWTQQGVSSCDTLNHLDCFEQ